MKKLILGIVILGIGIGSTYVGVMQFYRYVHAPQILPAFFPRYSQYVYQGEGLPPEVAAAIEEERTKARLRDKEVENRRRNMVSTERRVRKPAPISNVSKKVEPKKEVNTGEIKEEKPLTLQEPAPVLAPITEKGQSPLSAKLIAYLDVEKILSWLANIITIITGILIILRKRHDV